MAKMINQVGSVSTLIEKINFQSLFTFNSFDEILDFQKNYKQQIKNVKSQQREIIIKQIIKLKQDYEILWHVFDKNYRMKKVELEDEKLLIEKKINQIENNKLIALIYWLLGNHKKKLKTRYERIVNHFEEEQIKPFEQMVSRLNSIRYEYLDKEERLDNWVNKQAENEIIKINQVKKLIDNNQSLISGSIGELKVSRKLASLPDEYYVINDYYKVFDRAIYFKKENEYIKSVQIDHVVVGPTGLFLIETKNWSEQSLQNSKLFSPLKQLDRFSYVVFVHLNKEITRLARYIFEDHFGTIKVSPKSILVLIRNKPKIDYQFVKIAHVNELQNIILNNEVIFNSAQIDYLVAYFTNDHNRIYG